MKIATLTLCNEGIPDSGVLTRSMLFDAGATIPAGRFIQPRIEAELPLT